MDKLHKFESIPLATDMLSDLKRKVQARNWIIVALAAAVILLSVALVVK